MQGVIVVSTRVPEYSYVLQKVCTSTIHMFTQSSDASVSPHTYFTCVLMRNKGQDRNVAYCAQVYPVPYFLTTGLITVKMQHST